jgi:NOL1/NOP2/fmu family ribosome biogenesis protein
MSLNIQSLPAKFGDFKELIDNLTDHKCNPEILLQEIWQVADPKLFIHEDYQPLIFKCRSNYSGGGVGIYLKKGIKFQHNINYFLGENFRNTHFRRMG